MAGKQQKVKGTARARSENIWGWLFVLPTMIGLIVLNIYPIINTIKQSFFKTGDFGRGNIFIGVDNYVKMLSDPETWDALLATFKYAIIEVPFSIAISLVLAVLLNRKMRGRAAYRTIFFLPMVCAPAAVAMVWRWLFNSEFGLLNHILKLHINWLYDTKTAMLALIIVSAWKLIGYNMVIFLSGFSTINQSLYEAAKIDGANPIKTFFKITLPLLSPTVFFVAIITTISSFQVFDLIYLMTQGGPLNSTNVLVYWIYKNSFEFFNIGEASAGAYILFLIIFVLTYIQWMVRKKWVFNE